MFRRSAVPRVVLAVLVLSVLAQAAVVALASAETYGERIPPVAGQIAAIAAKPSASADGSSWAAMDLSAVLTIGSIPVLEPATVMFLTMSVLVVAARQAYRRS